MSELYHWGIKGQKWGVRNYQNADGSLTSAGRLRYGVGSAVRGGVFNSSNTAYSKAKKLAKFGTELAKAKTNQYTNAGRYKARRAKADFARRLRGKEANKQIARANRRRQIDYKISRARAKGFIDHLAGSTYTSVFNASNERFKRRISVGQKYVELSKLYVPKGAINKINWDNIEVTLPEIKIGRETLPGISRFRLK